MILQTNNTQIYSLEDLVYFSSHPLEMFEHYYLIDIGKEKIISELNEKHHIYNYGKDIDHIVHKIVKVKNTKRASVINIEKSYLQSMDWLSNLTIYVEYSIASSQTIGKTLFSKSIIDRQTKMIENGSIKITVSARSTIDSIEGCVRHELKNLFTNLVENITSANKDILFRASNIDASGMYNKFRFSGPEGWDLDNEHRQNYSKIKNTIVEFCYYVNEDEMRSKLENVVSTFKFWFDNFELGIYLIKYLDGNKTQIAQSIYDDINVIMVYKRANQFCESIKIVQDIINYLDATILEKANEAYNKKWKSSIELLDYLISRFDEFIIRTQSAISIFVEEANSKIENQIRKLKSEYLEHDGNISFNNFIIKKLSKYKFIKSL